MGGRKPACGDTSKPLTLDSYPRAIAHIDGDAFFTSVEQSLNPQWRNRPIVTGAERNIIACASYEAKALGIKRGVALHEARKICPDLIVLPSDYETYSLASKRMFDIMRRFTPMVEEHSIDEGFADLTGLRRVHRCSYEDIARNMKQAIQAELGFTVSVGLSLSKGLAKLCSKFRKPDGFVAVPGYYLHLLLARTPLKEVWGFGPNAVALLEKFGLKTALEFVHMPETWATKMLNKPGHDIWCELRGRSVYPVSEEEKSDFASVSKCKTFTAVSSDRAFVFAKLVRNVESACIKLRRHKLRARVLWVALRRADFSQSAIETLLTRATSSAHEMMPVLSLLFERLYEPEADYRATMVVMSKVEADRFEQYELFEDPLRIERQRAVAQAVDEVAARYGKHKLSLATSLDLGRHQITSRDATPSRKADLLPGETTRCRLALPRLNVTV